MIDPPPAYDFPYPGPLTEWVLPAKDIDPTCRKAGVRGAFQIMACQFEIGDRCYLVLPMDTPNRYRRHENAHCNGWRH